MIDAKALLADLTRQLTALEDDLRGRIRELPLLKADLEREWQAARDAERCAETFESWSEQLITQAGVHWLLSCVFLRFIEDNTLVERPWLAGTPASGRLALARDRFEAWLRAHPLENDRSYLLEAFREAGTLPGLQTFFDPAHNPLYRFPVSADAAMALRQFWLQVDPDTGALRHDFTDPEWNTRFLGDLYQDLSEATRKRYALLQTPEFVEAFILDRTLTPAIRTFGFREVRLIDPTCGSGHFLLGAFERLVAQWQRHEPARNPVDIAQKALDAVAGVDLNPFAVAIARFRLWVAALKVAGVQRLAHAPNFKLQVAIGDSLLHGIRFGLKVTDDLFDKAERYERAGLAHAYASEDLEAVNAILGRQYHAVVGNPPYIVVRDAALNQAYRNGYVSCHRQYSLGVPFTERFFELALSGDGTAVHPGGFVGLITANSFMKREFGSKLIEEVLPLLDLTHVIDTAGAYIPGHGTPTVILFGRHQRPVASTVRTVMGIKGEPNTPDDPARGLVWTTILEQVDREGSESDFVSVTDTSREVFGRHPWSIGGGGASELRARIDESSSSRLKDVISDCGFGAVTREDEAYMVGAEVLTRLGISKPYIRPAVDGETVRDWAITDSTGGLFPYVEGEASADQATKRFLWPLRTGLSERVAYGKTQLERGLEWFEYSMYFAHRFEVLLTISFAEIATHNHFVLDRGGKVFKQTAPVIKLPAGSSEDAHLGLLGLLNSSVACFWMKQVAHQKQMMGGDGIRISEKSKVPYQFASTQLKELPLPSGWPNLPQVPRLTALARETDQLARSMSEPGVEALIDDCLASGVSIAARWQSLQQDRRRARSRLILLQEEMDFLCYEMYGLVQPGHLTASSLDFEVELEAGDRPFCIAAGANVEGFTVPAEIPRSWPATMRELWERRLNEVRTNAQIKVIEDPHYKRRWIGRQGLFNHGARADEFKTGCESWLLDRLESERYWPRQPEQPQILSTWRLSELARRDATFVQVAEVYAGSAEVDLHALVSELVASEAVPSLPAQRYADTGLRKRAQWEATWTLQRREDAGEDVGRIPVPPKYQSKDFSKPGYWKLRGALDVPKERWVSYPGCERGSDASLPIVWAGWNHLQQAQAIAAYYMEMKDVEGWPTDRLIPLLAALQQLVPWLQQWHNELDPDFGERMGDYYAGFLADEARSRGLTVEALAAWTPPTAPARRGRRPRS